MNGGGNILVTNSSQANNNDVINLLRSVGVEVQLNYHDATDYDYAIDVGGTFSKNPPKSGISEVTRSGYHEYAKNGVKQAIINVDDSKLKLLETFFGNPKSVLRGINQFLGEPESFLKGKKLIIIGFGKIGRGIARLFQKYCDISVCDINSEILAKAQNLGFKTYLITENNKTNSDFLIEKDIVITCTGFPQTITNYFIKSALQGKLLINLGAVDEFGSDYTSEEVFMSKDRPFNFNLDPPTENHYIDAILAGHVEGLRYLATNNVSPGIHSLPENIDENLLKRFKEYNNEDISDLFRYFDVEM
jgi:adenosylhomocysteinase